MIVRNDKAQMLNDWQQGLSLIQSQAKMLSVKFEGRLRQAESLKIAAINHQLEKHRKSLARHRGITSIGRDGKRLYAGLGVAVAASLLAGIMTKDKFAAANAGLSGFDGVIQGLGETDWAVSLGRSLTIVPRGSITSERVWVTWDSLKAALVELEGGTLRGDKLGSIDNIISKLQMSKRLVRLNVLTFTPITRWTKVEPV